MRKIVSLIIMCAVAAIAVAQVGQFGKAFKTGLRTTTSAIVTSKLLESLGNISTYTRIQPIDATGVSRTPIVEKTKSNLQTTSNASSLGRVSTANLYNSPLISIFAKEYASFKEKYATGMYDTRPWELLSNSSYADCHGETDFARELYQKAKSRYLTVQDVYHFCKNCKGLRENCGDLIAYIVQRNYIYRAGDIVPFKADSITEAHKQQLLELAREHAPDLVPVIEIVYRADDSRLLDLYSTVTDSIISGTAAFETAIQNHIISVTLDELIKAKKFDEALKYFTSEPLTTFAAGNADIALTLCEAARGKGDTDKFDYYLKIAGNIDSIAARQYYDDYYSQMIDLLVDNPTNLELADWLIANNACPAELAMTLIEKIEERYTPKDYDVNKSYEWSDKSQLTAEQLHVQAAILHIADCALNSTEGNSSQLAKDHLKLIYAITLTTDSAEIGKASGLISELTDKVSGINDPDYDNLRIGLVVARAYIAAHGIDRPKEAYDILNRQTKVIENMSLDPSLEFPFWQYLLNVSELIGKKKTSKKCREAIAKLPPVAW